MIEPYFENLLIHELALGAPAQTPKDLEEKARVARSLRAAGIEFLADLSLAQPIEEDARAMLRGGATAAAMCVAFTEQTGDSLDPSFEDEFLRIMIRLIGRVGLMRSARCIDIDHTLRIDSIVGPFMFQLGKEYDGDQLPRIVNLLKILAPHAEKTRVRLCLERLQSSEDKVIRTAARLRQIIDEVGSPWVIAHDDSFNACANDERPEQSVRILRGKIGHYHTNGYGYNPGEGRIPCGCDSYAINGRKYSDKIQWKQVAAALMQERRHRRILIAIESFHTEAIKAIPLLGTGVVAVTDLEHIREAVRNLERDEMLIEHIE